MTAYEAQLAERGLAAIKRLTEVLAATALLEHQRYALAGKFDPPLAELKVAAKCAEVLTKTIGITA